MVAVRVATKDGAAESDSKDQMDVLGRLKPPLKGPLWDQGSSRTMHAWLT